MKQISFFLACLLLPFGLFATVCIPNCECETDWTLEVRAAYYHPTSKQLHRAFARGFIDYQVEAAKRIYDFFEVWGSINWASHRGHVHEHARGYYEFKDRTRINIIPISLGLKYIYPLFPYIDVYAGAGVSYSILKINNHHRHDYEDYGFDHAPFKKQIFKNDVGGLFKLGFQFAMSEETFFDFFADYFIQRFHFSRHDDKSKHSNFKGDLNCNGFKIGAGFGVYF